MPNQNRDRVFVSYSHKDKEWLEKFNAVLAPDIRNGRVDYWDDRELQPGDPWCAKILDGIRSAQVAVLLVSPNFLASRFVMEEELPQILAVRDDGLTIIWVPLFGTFYGPGAPPQIKPLTEVQAAFDAGKPLAEQDPASQTALLLDLCRHIQRLLNPSRVPSNLPFTSLAELFKGRDEALTQLDRSFRQHGSAAIVQPQAIHGLGGIGKTRLAIEYAWRHQDDFTAFLFVSANTPDDFERNLAALSRPDCLDLPETQAPQQEEQRDAVVRWLQQNRGWLLILDNVDTDEGVRAVKALVAKLRGGHVLITSRVTEWGRGVHPLALDVLQPDDAVALLLESAQSWRPPRLDDPAQARALANCLGCLPLALTHATAYMQHHHQGFTAYLDDFEKHFERLLAYHDHLAIEYETELEEKSEEPATPEATAARKKFVKTIATTFFLSFDRIASEAKAILQSVAFLAPDPIPVAMFEQCPDEIDALVNLWCEETGAAKSGRSVADALAELARYSLITRGEGVFSIHRMEQLVLWCRVAKDHTPKWIEATRAVLCKYAPDETAENPQTWPVWDLLRPHAEVLVAFAKDDSRVQPHLGLLQAMGQLYYGKALYKEGLAVDGLALQVAEKLHGPHSAEMADRLLSYGETLRVLGRDREAENAFRRSLAIREKANGPYSLEVASILNYLAAAIDKEGRAEEKELLLRRAFRIHDSHTNGDYDQKHDFARNLNNLGSLLTRKGALDESEQMLTKALRLTEEAIGREHPHTLACAANLALLLAKKKDFNAAETLMRKTLEISERVLGPEHPETICSIRDLASLLDQKGDYTGAEPLYHRVLDTRERVLGLEHPNTLSSVNNLADLLGRKGDYVGAEPLYRRGLEARGRVLGQEHTDTLRSAKNLADLLDKTGRGNEAVRLRMRVIGARERAAGSEPNPELAIDLNNLGLQFRKLHRLAEAESCLRRALAIDEYSFSPDDPKVASDLCNLAQLLQDMNRLAEAEPLMHRALEIIFRFKAANGHSHPAQSRHVLNFRTLLSQLGRSQSEVQAQLNAIGKPFGIQLDGGS